MRKIKLALLSIIIGSVLLSLSFLPARAEGINCADTDTTGVTQAECEALVALYNSTNGASWTNSENWLSSSEVDTWYGVEVTSEHVTGMLNLSTNNLVGPLPPEIGDLEWVTYFYLVDNHLSGTIPPEIADVSGLVYLYLYQNELTGEIPVQLFSLPNIKDIVLSGNHLSGNIPAEIGNTETLERFIVNDNDLSGELPVGLGNLNGLTHFSVGGNDLFGPLPLGMAGWYSPMSLFNIRQNGFWTTDSDLLTYLDTVQPGWDINLSSQALEPSHRDHVGWGKLADSEEFTPQLVFSKFFYRTGGAAVKYLVLVYKADNTKILEVELTDSQVCPTGGTEISSVCTFVPNWSDFIDKPSIGSYYWTVLSSDGSGWAWNDKPHEFEIVSPPVVMYPTSETTKLNPTFKWQPVAHAKAYNLVVIDSGSDKVMDELIPSSICSASGCKYTPTTGILSLANGSYTWKVRADMGVESYTDWGDASFTKIAPPTPKFPAVSSTTPNPKFIWSKVANQTRYQVQLYTSGGVLKLNKTFDAATVCASSPCSYTPSPALSLANGGYKWKVRAGDSVEWGTFSAVKTFNKVAPPAPITPTGTITATNPKFTWKKIPGATKYYLVLKTSTGVIKRQVEITAPVCNFTTCSYTPTPVLNLAKGVYKWQVKAYNGYYGPYGVFMIFTRN